MKYEINNFAGGLPLTVKTAEPSDLGPLIYVIQYAGSLNFQHTMTTTQAREMAAALIDCADAQDAPIDADFAAHRESPGVEA